MDITLNGEPFEGSKSNSVENVADGIARAAGECSSALGGRPGRIEARGIPGVPEDLVVIVQIGPDAPKGDGKGDAPKGDKAPKEKASK